MKEPGLYDKFFWKFLVNIVGKICFGYFLIFALLIYFIKALAHFFGAEFNGEEFPLYNFPLFIILFVLGILVIRAKPYYPKKYREWLEWKKKSSNQGKK
jgi:hypothetical protein